jgi:hypothetical protein
VSGAGDPAGPDDRAGPPRTITLTWWDGPWPADDPDAGFKADVALSRLVDPLPTLERLARATGIPIGALCQHVLVRWTQAGSEALLRVGPSVVERMAATCAAAEADGTDAARLAAYESLRGIISWLQVPLDDPRVYPDPTAG